MRAIVLVMLIFLLPVAHAEVTVCEKGCDFSSIQDAIDAAVEGDTVVAEGYFFENLNITKSITLKGNATIYPSGTEAGVSIFADNVKVSGMKIKGGITGIEVVNAKEVDIENCNFDRNFYGILLLQSSQCKIKENGFENINESAIRLDTSGLNSISSNYVKNSMIAVHLLHSSGNNITDSSFKDVKGGVYIEESIDNNIIGNEISAPYAIFIYQSSLTRVSKNSAESDVFVSLLFSSKNTIEFNKAEGIYINHQSQKNNFLLDNVKLKGEEFEFSTTEPKLPDEFVSLSSVLNVTVKPDPITDIGYVELEGFASNLSKMNLSTIGFYRITNEGMDKLSESYIENETAKSNITVNESGLYIFAGKIKASIVPSPSTTPTFPTESTSNAIYYIYLILIPAVAVILLLLIRWMKRRD